MFRFTGWDIEKYDDQITVTMKDYAKSIEMISEIRKGDDRHDLFIWLEMKQYWKQAGKISQLAEKTRPDLGHTALTMSKRNETAMIGDLHNMICVMKRVDLNSME